MSLSTFHREIQTLYRKPNDDPLYINKHSNHPPSILRQLPTSISKRISTLSSDKQTFEDAAPAFEDAAPAYQNALGHSNFSHKLEYTPHETQRPRRNRQRNVIWFNPPCRVYTMKYFILVTADHVVRGTIVVVVE